MDSVLFERDYYPGVNCTMEDAKRSGKGEAAYEEMREVDRIYLHQKGHGWSPAIGSCLLRPAVGL